MINYSIIIPHRNIPHLLQRCLDSIPRRDDIQIIIVDDNSDVSIVNFDQFPGMGEKGVDIIFTKEGKGAGYARNVGLKYAKGKWLLFADADDYYTEHIFAVLEKYKSDKSTDLVFLNAQSVNEKKEISSLLISKYIDNYKNKKYYSEKVLRYANWVPWTRMVKHEMVEKYNLRYEEIPIGNDAIFCLNCSKFATNILFESEVVYNYYKPSTGSCTYHYYNISNLTSMIDLRFRINNLYKEVGFVFKQTFLKGGLLKNRMIDSNNYKKCYKEALLKNNYSLITDLGNTFIYYIGKILQII